MQSPPFPRFLVPPRSKYSPQHPVLKHHQLPFLAQYQRPSFTPIQNNGQNYGSIYRRCLQLKCFAICNVIIYILLVTKAVLTVYKYCLLDYVTQIKYKGPEGKSYGSTLSLTSALDGGWMTNVTSRFLYPGKSTGTRYMRAGWAQSSVGTGEYFLCPPALQQSLYRKRHRG